MKLLISRGPGNIRSHMVRYALKNEHDVVGFDDFSTGHVEDQRIRDFATLGADSAMAKSQLVWKLQSANLTEIVASAWSWHNNQEIRL